MLKVAKVAVDKLNRVVVYLDKEANAGDWVYNEVTKKIDLLVEGEVITIESKPIIAIEASPIIELPTPTPRFIDRVHAVEGTTEAITHILVEFYTEDNVKVKPDNTITVRKVEEFLNKDSTVSLLMEFANEFVVNAIEADVQARIAAWILAKVK
jgi:hypothetical protein